MKSISWILILFILLISWPAVSLDGIEVNMGQLWSGNADPEPLTASPLVFNLGIALPISLSRVITFSPELSFSAIDYVWDEDDARAVPADPEMTWGRFEVLQILLDPTFLFLFPLNEKYRLGFGFSPAFLFRLPLIAYDDGESTRSYLTSYFYQSGRFFYPALGPEFTWRFSESMTLRFSARLYWPLHHFYDGEEELALWDQMMVRGNMGFLFTF